MNLFQILAVPLLAILFVRSMVKLIRGSQPRGVALFGVAIWLAAGVAILQPELTIRIAKLLGIGRGADLVLYFLVITYLLSCFYFYNRILKLESHMTEIVRQLTIRDAVHRWPPTELESKREEKSSEGGPLLRGTDRNR